LANFSTKSIFFYFIKTGFWSIPDNFPFFAIPLGLIHFVNQIPPQPPHKPKQAIPFLSNDLRKNGYYNSMFGIRTKFLEGKSGFLG
jgi:hypothetical protein